MLTESRKRPRTQGDDDVALLMPQTKRSSTLQCSEGSREAWDFESFSSDSSRVSSPEHAAGTTSSSSSSQYGAENLRSCSPHSSSDQSDATGLTSYKHINRVLREAHFHSLHNRGHTQDR